MKCWECNGTYRYKNVDFSVYGISFGKFKAKVCSKCQDTVFSEEVSDQMDAIAKQKGLWGLESKTKVGKVGNSLDIKIGQNISKFCDLKKGDTVVVHPERKKRLVVNIV